MRIKKGMEKRMEETGSKKGTENGKISGKTALIVCIAVIVILIGMIAFLLLERKTSDTAAETEQRRNVVVNEQNAEEVAEDMVSTQFTEPGYYTVNMATEWHFATGDAVSSDARVDNVAGNTNPVYFDLFLEENEEEPIYCSPVIPVGSFLEHIALDRPLEAGDYDCVVVYHLVDEEQNTISTLRVAIRIMVEA